jgi:hypothetical protein
MRISHRRIGSLQTDRTDMKSALAATLLPMLGVIIAMTTSCESASWLSSLGQAPVHVAVANGCPAELAGAQDVANSYTGDELVPPGPDSALICRYWSRFPETPAKKVPGSLYASVVLATSDAVHLATVIDAISTAAPKGTFHCPADLGSASVIAFAYAGRADVDLWFSDSGCATLDNGRIAASENGNPSFYNNFLTLMGELAPQRYP